MSDQPERAYSFRELMFADLQRYEPGRPATWLRVLSRCLVHPGIVASLILRAQEKAYWSGRVRAAFFLRSLGHLLVGADFVPGMRVGKGLLMPHPSGIVIGNGLVVGDNVTFGGGITAGVKQADAEIGTHEFPTICDGAIVLANAVLVGGVRIGEYAQVGANSVVLSDVADRAVVFGIPARKIAEREPKIPGSLDG